MMGGERPSRLLMARSAPMDTAKPPPSCGDAQFGSGVERAEHIEALEVGHGGREQRLQARPSSSPVAGLAHTQVLEVVDLALDLGPPAQQRLGRRLGLGRPGGGDASLVYADGDLATAFGCGALGLERTGRAGGGGEDETGGGPALVVSDIGGGLTGRAGDGPCFEVDLEVGRGPVHRHRRAGSAGAQMIQCALLPQSSLSWRHLPGHVQRQVTVEKFNLKASADLRNMRWGRRNEALSVGLTLRQRSAVVSGPREDPAFFECRGPRNGFYDLFADHRRTSVAFVP